MKIQINNSTFWKWFDGFFNPKQEIGRLRIIFFSGLVFLLGTFTPLDICNISAYFDWNNWMEDVEKMNEKFAALLITSILMLTLLQGCDPPEERNNIERVQDKLLNELDYCENKFSSSERSTEYCNTLLQTIERLVADGYFSDDEETQEVLKEVTQEQNIIYEEEPSEVNDAINEIIGDI